MPDSGASQTIWAWCWLTMILLFPFLLTRRRIATSPGYLRKTRPAGRSNLNGGDPVNLATGNPYAEPRRALYLTPGVDRDLLIAAAVVCGCIVAGVLFAACRIAAEVCCG